MVERLTVSEETGSITWIGRSISRNFKHDLYDHVGKPDTDNEGVPSAVSDIITSHRGSPRHAGFG